jgi:hypothetical protein
MVVLCVALFTLLVLFWTRTPHSPSLPPISPSCYLPKSGRHVTSLDQGLSSSEARSGKSMGTRLERYIPYVSCTNLFHVHHEMNINRPITRISESQYEYAWPGIFLNPARCGYTLRVTSHKHIIEHYEFFALTNRYINMKS